MGTREQSTSQLAAVRRRRAPRLPREQRRALILDAALRLIDRNGYAAANMEAIAREARVAKPVVYDLFGDLGRLLQALLAREEERALAQLAGALPSVPTDEDPDALLVGGIREFLEAVRANPTSWRLILRPVDGMPSVVGEYVARNRRQLTRQIERLLAWGVQRRGGPEGLDVELAARSIIALGEQTALLVLADPERFPPERIGRFVGGLLAQLERGPESVAAPARAGGDPR